MIFSILLHAVILFCGGKLLFRPAQFNGVGQTNSIELDLVNSPTPGSSLPLEERKAETAPATVSILPRAKSKSVALHSQKVFHTEKATGAAFRGNQSASPDYLHNPPPAYPPKSQERSEQGTVMLAVRVNRQGNPAKLAVRRSSGYPRLDRAALEAVHRWRFHPALAAGTAVESEVVVPVRFELR